MKYLKALAIIVGICCLTSAQLLAAEGKPIKDADKARGYDFNKFMQVKWVVNPQISPDGKHILFQMDTKDLKKNKNLSSLYILQLSDGKVSPLLPRMKNSKEGRWSPDSSQILFSSSDSGESQIYVTDLRGRRVKKLTSLALGASAPIWSSDAKSILFVSDVYTGAKNEAENVAEKEARAKSQVKARMLESLPYLVFDHWRDGKHSHLFYMPISTMKPVDLISGNYDVPPIDLGLGTDYAISPDLKNVCYTTNIDKNLAWSTNNNLFLKELATGKLSQLTKNPANDSGIEYSPDGKYIAYTSMKRAGFEADERVLNLYELATGKIIPLTAQLDRSINEFVFSPDGSYICFSADNNGYSSLYKVELATAKVSILTERTFDTSPTISKDGKTIYFLRQSIIAPAEIYSISSNGGEAKQLTCLNPEFKQFGLTPAKSFEFAASDGVNVQGFIITPPNFDPNKKYPMILLIHGGPQGAWSDDFHKRWNTALFAASGYVTATVNFRGSHGYGQKFTDGVSKDWGGRPYQDIMEGVDYLLNTYSFIDKDRMGVVGASYGGFMTNWIMGHTDRFKCAISFSGVFNTVSEYGTTEELWFPEWEFGGTPYENRELYEKFNPINYVKNFKTPCLVIHGEQDFRVPISQAKQLFTALQRNGVESKFLYFPDECHFVRKPQNMQLWYTEMFKWFDQHLKK